MDDGSRLPWLLAVLLLLCAAFLAVTETAFASASRPRLKAMADAGNAKAKKALSVLDDFDRAITTILILTNIVHLSTASIVTLTATRRWGLGVVTLSTLLTTVAVFFVGEMLPKSFAKKLAEPAALFCAGPISFFMRLLTPLSSLLTAIGEKVSATVRGEPELSVTEDELSVFVVNPTALKSSEVFARGLDEGLGVDGKKEYIDFSAMSTENEYGYVNQQTLVVRLAANTVDATVMEYSRFYVYAVNGGYADLRTYFTEDQLATLDGALWYMDGSTLARALSPENTDDIEEEEGLISKDATDFADPVPVGIDPECSEIFSEVFVYTDEPGCAGICAATQRPEMAVRFMQYIFPSLA